MNDTSVIVLGAVAGILLAIAILLSLVGLTELVRTVHG